MVRARWSTLLGGSELLHAAFSLESVADEVIFVAGPVLVTLLATEVYRPNPAANCFHCRFKPLCPLYPEGRPVLPVEVAS